MNTSTQTTDTQSAAKTPRKPRASYRLLSHFDLDQFGLKVETVEQGKVTDTAIFWSPWSITVDQEVNQETIKATWKALVSSYSAARFIMDTRKDVPSTLSAVACHLRTSDLLLEGIDSSVKEPKEKGGKASENLQLALLVNELRAELAEARKENLELTRRLMTYLERNGA